MDEYFLDFVSERFCYKFHPQTTMGQPCSKCGVQRKPGARLADECDSDVGGTKNRCCNCEFEKYNKRERGHCVHCIARESGASDCEHNWKEAKSGGMLYCTKCGCKRPL